MIHRRTSLQRIEVRNFRSIEHLVLEELPEMVVFHGPGGSGKSNVLRAVRLVLRAASRAHLPGRREDAWVLSAADADAQLGLRPEDFRRGTTEMSVALRLGLGSAAIAALGIEGMAPTTLTLECCAQLSGAEQLRVWFPLAETDEGLGLWNSSGSGSLSRIVATLQNKEAQLGKNRTSSKLPEAIEMRLKIEQGLALRREHGRRRREVEQLVTELRLERADRCDDGRPGKAEAACRVGVVQGLCNGDELAKRGVVHAPEGTRPPGSLSAWARLPRSTTPVPLGSSTAWSCSWSLPRSSGSGCGRPRWTRAKSSTRFVTTSSAGSDSPSSESAAHCSWARDSRGTSRQSSASVALARSPHRWGSRSRSAPSEVSLHWWPPSSR